MKKESYHIGISQVEKVIAGDLPEALPVARKRVIRSRMTGSMASLNMDRATFTALLHDMSVADRDFAARYVTNEMPDSFRYFAYLSESVDSEPLKPGEKVFAADAARYGKRIGPLTEQAVAVLLWRDGLVPEWIDISVVDADAVHTYFELRCCGRYTAEGALMYYTERGQGPFGLKSPTIPPGWSEDMPRFALPAKLVEAPILRGGCYCTDINGNPVRRAKLPLGYCGTCCICGAPGHARHSPLPVPVTEGYCDPCFDLLSGFTAFG